MRWVTEIGTEFKGAISSVAFKSLVDIKRFFLVDVYPQTFSIFSDSEMVYFATTVIGAAIDMGVQVLAFIFYVCGTTPVYPELQVRVIGVAGKISIERIFKINKKGMAIGTVND
jgi:hypothetical protein